MTVPLPAGCTVRAPTPDDVSLIVNLVAMASHHDTGEVTVTEEEIARQFSMPGVDMAEVSWMVFNASQELIAIGLAVSFPPHVQIYGLTSIHPDHREQHLIDYMMYRVIAKAETYLPQAPEDARVDVIMGVDGRNKWLQGVLSDFEFSKVRAFFEMRIDMETPPPDTQFPDGLRLRPFDPDTQMHELFLAVDEAFRDHYGHVEHDGTDADEFERWKHNVTRAGKYDPALFFVAVDGDEIAGMALCRPRQDAKPDTGYISILGVRRQWRGQGLAKALLYHSFGQFYQRGTFKVALGVDAESLTGATQLYEKVGMRAVEEAFTYRKCIRDGLNLVKETLD